MNENATPIPVTIVTGFLGAGKTTFLNGLLKKHPKSKFLIIENEAGNINIDGMLLEKNDNNVIELTDGCICCSLNAELGTLLNSLILAGAKYDYLIIEATGMADPSEVIQLFMGNRAQQYFRLDAVVALVDAGLFLSQFTKYEEIRRQLAQSDIILINKTDLATEADIKKITGKIKTLNPFARLFETKFGETPDINILDSWSYQPGKIEKSIIDFSSFKPVASNTKKRHGISTFGFTIEGNLNAKRFSFWLEDFLFTNSDKILRIKGVLSIHDMKQKIILQSVSGNFQVLNGSAWSEPEARKSRMVFIGTGIDEVALEEALQALTV
ncbi:CobW family GTP-binding protein [Alkalitalea saponilacus]|uniref:GTPase, G3E family n=1 Tax=Alkalitalea saponilacus TaxID=889453 RepID=A0A1T5GN15_9BACT|nr:GTP-binding protein [Alkalitalea saponilacus]ASB48256.1 hypothetical protein CDL62_03420 [Alkalitalea saponilacus]SKC09812.1 GTPase, G3E family [Alkalitalea saponilacus]